MKEKLLICVVVSLQLHAYNQLHLSKLQQIVEQKKSINASHADLRGIGTALQGFNLSGAQLSGVLFDNISDVPLPQFSGIVQIPKQISDLSGVNLSDAHLVSTSFKGAVLHNVNFDGADISYADFTNADLTGADLNNVKNGDLALFCNTIMPDGTIPTGSTWTSSQNKIFQIHNAVA